MVTLDLELTQEACSRLYDALVCLAKIDETLTIEARSEQVCKTIINIATNRANMLMCSRQAQLECAQLDKVSIRVVRAG